MPYDTETLKVLDKTDLQANKEKENMKILHVPLM